MHRKLFTQVQSTIRYLNRKFNYILQDCITNISNHYLKGHEIEYIIISYSRTCNSRQFHEKLLRLCSEERIQVFVSFSFKL